VRTVSRLSVFLGWS